MTEACSLSYDADALAAAAERLGLRLVVLYGSRVPGGRARPESDLDIGVLAGSPRLRLLDALRALGPVFAGYDLDLAVLNGADPLFRYEVFSRSVLLYGDPDVYAEARAHAFRAWVDAADLLAFERRLYEKKLDRLLHAAT